MTERRAIVTGGAGTLGRAIAAALLAEGWRVTLLDRVAEVAGAVPGADGIPCDITDAAARAEALSRVAGSAGRLAGLVNCAGIGQIRPVFEVDPALWHQVMEVNLAAPFFLAQAAARHIGRDGGAIVNIASVSGLRASHGRCAYGTSKAALIHLTRQLAVELAPLGITCNAVAPGPVDGPLAHGHHPPDQVADYLATIPQGRYARPDEVAAAVAFLMSEGARHITGTCLPVDGGWTRAGIGLAAARTDAANHAAPPARES